MTVATPRKPSEPDELQALIEEARLRARRRRRRNGRLVAVALLMVAVGYGVVARLVGARPSEGRPRVSQAGPLGTRDCDETPSGLSALAFPTVADGWVLAAPGPASAPTAGMEVLSTRDGGSSWRCQLASNLTPAQLVATDTQHAWILGWRGVGCGEPIGLTRCSAEVVGTQDGSKWYVLSRPAQLVTQLAFASARVGLAAAHDRACPEPGGLPPPRCPGEVLMSSDGGRHWRAVLHTPDPVVAVAADRGMFWAAETRLGLSAKGGGRPGVTVLVSGDHGRSWRAGATITLPSAGLRQQVQLVPGSGGELSMSVFDQDDCAMHGCGGDGLWLSRDSGRTWQMVDPLDNAEGVPGVSCGISGEISVAGEATGYAWASQGPSQATCERPAATLFSSAPRYGGRSSSPWTVVYRWPSFRPVALAWPAASTGYALGTGGVARTSDGGRRWVQVLPRQSPALGLDGAGVNIAYGAQDATDQGAVLATTDGGHSWSALASLPIDVEVVDFVSPDTGFAAGAVWDPATNAPEWQLYGTRAGKRSWSLRSTLPLHPGQQVSGLSMASSERGLMAVSSGFIYPQFTGGVTPASLWVTSDGGRRWTRARGVPLPSSDVLRGASFTAAGHDPWAGWLLTDTGIRATTDAGGHWRWLQHTPNLAGIDLVSPRFGVGWNWTYGQMTLWRTSDAGGRWVRISVPRALSSRTLRAWVPFDVSFISPTDGWLLADQTTWRTTNGGRSWRSR